jgi:urate oxidase
MTQFIHNSYGKGRVRLTKIIREADQQIFKDYNVEIKLEGAFETAYTQADNSVVYPTDSMKNSVYALASQHNLASPEEFAHSLAGHFLQQIPHLHQATIKIAEKQWQRIFFDGQPHPHTFTGESSEQRTVKLCRSREHVTVEVGLANLPILKTTNSGFVGFMKDQFTTLPAETDRILGTNLTASWQYSGEVAYNDLWQGVRQTLLNVFAEHHSLSVQHTLYDMGEAVLKQHPAVVEIYLAMPNLHNIPFDLSKLGLENKKEIFVPIDEPHGMIEGRLRR